MALNIKSEEAHELAGRLARARGASLTEAVTVALRETLQRAARADEGPVLIREVKEIQRFLADLPDRDSRSPDEILGYDHRGLPG